MNTHQPQHGGFEERLLHELRSLLVAHSSEPKRPLRRPRAWAASRPRRRLALAGGVALLLALAAGAGVPLVTGGAAPAYAVSANDDGTVTVEINSLDDAAGLERKLRDAGIRAVVQYLPRGKTCKQPWFTPASREHGPGHQWPTTGGFVHTDDGHARFTIGSHHPTDAALVIVAEGGADRTAASIAVAFASEVGTCEIVNANGR